MIEFPVNVPERPCWKLTCVWGGSVHSSVTKFSQNSTSTKAMSFFFFHSGIIYLLFIQVKVSLRLTSHFQDRPAIMAAKVTTHKIFHTNKWVQTNIYWLLYTYKTHRQEGTTQGLAGEIQQSVSLFAAGCENGSHQTVKCSQAGFHTLHMFCVSLSVKCEHFKDLSNCLNHLTALSPSANWSGA